MKWGKELDEKTIERLEREALQQEIACHACGDVTIGAKIFQGVYLCKECYDELKKGIIQNQNISIVGGRPGPPEEGGPWYENSIRALEDY